MKERPLHPWQPLTLLQLDFGSTQGLGETLDYLHLQAHLRPGGHLAVLLDCNPYYRMVLHHYQREACAHACAGALPNELWLELLRFLQQQCRLHQRECP